MARMHRLTSYLMITITTTFLAMSGPGKLAALSPPREYEAIKQDDSLYWGEGVARLGDHGGDPLETERAALLQARGALAEAIEVRISVITSDIIVGGSKAAREMLSTKSSSVSLAELVNVKTRTYPAYPGPDDITVLATITKDDYRRLLGGRLDDSPHAALDLFLGGQILTHAQDLSQAMGQGAGSQPRVALPGFEISFGSWATDFSAFSYDVNGGTWDPRELQFTPNSTQPWHGHLQLFRGGFGYNWVLGHSRWQPYVPLRLECQWMSLSEVGNGTYPGAAGGIGLRYWFNNNFAIDLRGLWHQGFEGPSAVKDPRDPSGGNLMIFPPQVVSMNLDGPELVLAVHMTD
jgi:hypothetical protein